MGEYNSLYGRLADMTDEEIMAKAKQEYIDKKEYLDRKCSNCGDNRCKKSMEEKVTELFDKYMNLKFA